ncbi:BgTH12-05692 [Blumeria graminis f. sp. triticale]|uniref:BgTH12-05692 n=1 Tax=Blumeria graminis f. sp. triticale TaxID=1689686 RepID=A0A9W4GFT9_BLUGR|nr:BgTH12-05692 [Blumeria graminis f. sp. triticale]
MKRITKGIVKGLGLRVDHQVMPVDELLRGESIFASQIASTYFEEEPHTLDWMRQKVPSYIQLLDYVCSIFPFTDWILSYNLQWFLGDFIAGITVGAIVVPQSMAYSILAGLPPQYGLYTSFMGVLFYWLFATSKDISIGPVAVMSALVGNIVAEAKLTNPHIPTPVLASSLSLVCGIIITFIGLARCGWIVELVPLVSISAFMTGSAISIAIGQIPSLMGISSIDTRVNSYRVLTNTLRNLHRTRLDAALGLSALFLLYSIRWLCAFSIKKHPSKKTLFFYLSTLRTVFIIMLYTMISWLVNRNNRREPLFNIISEVPRGLTAAGVPRLNRSSIAMFASELPAAITVLLIEHIAIAKSFGRVNNYVINPSQEMVAIGMANILGPFIGGFASTGSFSRTAINSKAGVRTPIAGVVTAAVVLLAIYALPAVFQYIPRATLSAVIIHAVLDLITPPNTTYQFWRVSPIEVPILITGVIVTLFSTIENGIYSTMVASIFLFIFRFIKAKGKFLGRVKVFSATGDRILCDERRPLSVVEVNNPIHLDEISDEIYPRNLYLPLDRSDGVNPDVRVQAPCSGIFVFRFTDGFNYLNANHHLDQLTDHILSKTRRTSGISNVRAGDRPWNDPAPRQNPNDECEELPTLKAVILDFSAVNNVDITSMQKLIDVRNQLDFWAHPNVVDWHFTNISSPWTKRALKGAGFGYPSLQENRSKRWRPNFSVAEIVREENSVSAPKSTQVIESKQERDQNTLGSSDAKVINNSFNLVESSKLDARPHVNLIFGLSCPYFHADLADAWLSVALNVEKQNEMQEINSSQDLP